jgi:hypothetical protein
VVLVVLVRYEGSRDDDAEERGQAMEELKQARVAAFEARDFRAAAALKVKATALGDRPVFLVSRFHRIYHIFVH